MDLKPFCPTKNLLPQNLGRNKVLKIFSVILARGGSKGIPHKNIINLGGSPLLSYSINAALNSCCDETWVSTDCSSIKSVAQTHGAKVLDRPEELATDTATSESALMHFCEKVECDYIVFIQPTSPLLISEDINKGIDRLRKHNFDSIFSAYEEHWAGRWKYNPRDEYPGILSPHNYLLNKRPRRQDLPYKTYIENGAFYINSINSMKRGHRLSGHIGIYEMPFYRSFQIDTPEDLSFMETIIK